MPVEQVISTLRERHGLDVSCYDASYLGRVFEKRWQSGAGGTGEVYLRRLRDDPAEAAAFSSSLRVVYSDFFRNPLAFALLEQTILPALVEGKGRAARGEIRVWSAGCATGQEPWSVAILLGELARAHSPSGAYRVFATDVSESSLAQACTGFYNVAALGNVRLRHLDSSFCRQGDGFVVAPRIRERVEFSLYDLLDQRTTVPPASIYGDFDLVLCCNVLLYYRPEAQRCILGKLRRGLAPGGYLATGETERQIVEGAGGFQAVAPPASVFQKRGR